MKKAFVVSGTSVIARELIGLLQKDNISVVATGSNPEKLKKLEEEFNNITTFQLDITDNATQVLNEHKQLFEELDFVLICSGYGEFNYQLEKEIALNTIRENVNGFQEEVLLYFLEFFKMQHNGHIGVITSVGGVMLDGVSPSISTSNAFVKLLQSYLKIIKSSVKITDIMLELVDTPIKKGEEQFAVMPATKVAKQIYSKLKKNQSVLL